jgi:hypothetical protein
MLSSRAIDAALAPLGYSRFETRIEEFADVHRPAVFRATWSSDEIDHFLYLGADIKRHKYFVGMFGFRSRLAEDFSIATLLKYGHPNYRFWFERYARGREIGCLMNFGFDRFYLAEKRVEERIPLKIGVEELAQYITTLVDGRLFPIIREVTSPTKLFQTLVSDIEPCPWFATNCMARAAQIFAIGRHLDFPREVIREFLTPNYHLISRHMVEPDIKSSVVTFMDRLAADWESWAGSSSTRLPC